MAAVRIRFRAELRSRRRSWLGMVAIAGVAGGLVIALAAASHRTATAYSRFLTATRGADVYVDPGFAFGDESLDLDRIARLEQVAAAEPSAHLAVIARSRSGRSIYPAGVNPVQFTVPTDGRPRNTIDSLKLLEGRAADPRRAADALVDTKAAATLGVRVGDTLTMRVIDHDLMWNHPEKVRLTADPRTARVGPLATVRIVGLVANAKTTLDGGFVYLTSGFYRSYGGPALGSFLLELATRLKHGAADLPSFRASVQRIAGKRTYGFFESGETHPKVQRSIRLQAQALRVLTIVAAVAALLLVGQALLRQALLDARGQPILRALGMTRGQLVALGAARALTMAVPAALLSALLAVAVSWLTPFGWARELEPDPGVAVDGTIVVVGSAAVLAVVLVAGLLGAARIAARPGFAGESAHAATEPGSLASAIARAGLSPAAGAGVRMALSRRGGASAVPVRATLLSAVVAVGVAVTALTFAASLQHLLHTPRLYGQTWDFEAKGFGPPLSPSFVSQLVRDPALRDVSVGLVWPVEIGARNVGVNAMDDVKGSIPPVVLDGRAPRSPDEALLGPKTLDQLHARIGGAVTVHVGARAMRMRVVGTGIIPAGKWNELGEGAVFSYRALQRVEPEAPASGLAVRLAPGADREAALARLRSLTDGPGTAIVPADVADFGGVGEMPAIVALLFAAAAAGALAHALLSSIRQRRRDLAVLKTLGFTRRQVGEAVAWQATTIAAVGLLVGVPLGLGVGRFGWNLFATGLGVVPEAVTPIGLTLLVVPAAILLANLVAVLPGRIAARTRPALVLRAE
jgi:putative ABC transport system permease protein